MSRDGSFRRNVVIIGVLHVAVLAGLARWGGTAKKPAASEIIWMEGGAGEPIAVTETTTSAAEAPEPMIAPVPAQPEAEKPPIVEEEEQPEVMPINSEVQAPGATPTPAPTASPSPSATPSPKPSATPKGSPTPKASPRPTPKSSPKKTLMARASPKPKATAPAKQESASEAKSEKKDATASRADKSESDVPVKTSGVSVTSAENSGSTGTGGRGAGTGAASQHGWYANMLHDRFFSEWAQPTTVVATGAKMSALVRIRIEKDGRVSDFAIVRSSGNVVVDESVSEVAKRVTRVDPLPRGLGNENYEVKINFELNP